MISYLTCTSGIIWTSAQAVSVTPWLWEAKLSRMFSEELESLNVLLPGARVDGEVGRVNNRWVMGSFPFYKGWERLEHAVVEEASCNPSR